jgi:hypothetical protein
MKNKVAKVTGYKSLKKLFLELGFHHSWGYYIHNENKMWRISIGKNTFAITKKGCEYYSSDDFRYSTATLEQISAYVRHYFIPERLTLREKI